MGGGVLFGRWGAVGRCMIPQPYHGHFRRFVGTMGRGSGDGSRVLQCRRAWSEGKDSVPRLRMVPTSSSWCQVPCCCSWSLTSPHSYPYSPPFFPAPSSRRYHNPFLGCASAFMYPDLKTAEHAVRSLGNDIKENGIPQGTVSTHPKSMPSLCYTSVCCM